MAVSFQDLKYFRNNTYFLKRLTSRACRLYFGMIYHIGVNDIEPNHWVAWVFDLHACFSKAKTRDEAIAAVPQVIKEYFRWLNNHNHPFSLPDKTTELKLAEDIKSYQVNNDYIVNAFFEDDRRPLNANDIDEIGRLLSYTRRDLSEVIGRISAEQMNQQIEGEVQSTIQGILNHIATAERWYFDRIEMAFERREFPQDVLIKLKTARKHTIAMLPMLEGKTQIFLKRDEKWTARKVMRRTLWHEIAHTRQIENYLQKMGKSA